MPEGKSRESKKLSLLYAKSPRSFFEAKTEIRFLLYRYLLLKLQKDILTQAPSQKTNRNNSRRPLECNQEF